MRSYAKNSRTPDSSAQARDLKSPTRTERFRRKRNRKMPRLGHFHRLRTDVFVQIISALRLGRNSNVPGDLTLAVLESQLP